MDQPLIQLQGIKKVFYTDEVETHALSDIHLEIRNGEYVSIAGPSGCGKTTLLSILGLLDSPTEGSYTLDGQPVARLSASERARVRNRRIGFIFQAFNLIGDLTVYENVELPLTYRGMASDERRKRVQSALERVGMSHRMKHFPAQRAANRRRSRQRAHGEHGFHVVKRLWGFTTVRYRGLAKNLARAFTMFGLANLYLVRRRLLPPGSVPRLA